MRDSAKILLKAGSSPAEICSLKLSKLRIAGKLPLEFLIANTGLPPSCVAQNGSPISSLILLIQPSRPIPLASAVFQIAIEAKWERFGLG